MKSGTFVVVHVDAQYSICLITIPGKPPFFHIIKPDESDSPPISVAQINLSLKTVEETPPSSAEKQWSDIEFFRQVVLEQKRSAPFEELVHEVKKCIRYTQSQEGITHFDRVYLTGIGARSNSLTNLFQDNLQVDTLAWDPLGELYAKSNERPTVDDGFGFTPLLGAILRGGD